MAKSRKRRKNGKTVSGKMHKPTRKDRQNIQRAYITKFAEYSQMTLQELTELKEGGNIRGTYLRALEAIIEVKKRMPAPESTEETVEE